MTTTPTTFDPRVTENGDNKPHFRVLLKENWVSVMTDCLVFGSFGMGVAILGPTLFDLGCQTSASLRELQWVFFVQLLLTLVGSVSAGCLAQRLVPVHVLMLIGMFGLPFTMLLVPACTEFTELLLNLMLMGWCMGCIDCVANLRMILRFGTNVSPFLQAMHFCYGLGAFISPMIAAPFTLDVECSQPVNGKVTLDTFEPTTNSSGAQVPTQVTVSRAQHLSHSESAFFILASIQFLFTAIVIVVVILEKKRIIFSGVTVSQSASMTSVREATSEQDLRDISGQTHCFCFGTREIVVIILITSASLFLYDGLQSSYADYIYSFAVKNVNGLRKGEGAYLNACFWVAFEDVLAEPDGAHSIDCVWLCSYSCFNCGKNCCYKLMTTLCGMCLALAWGCEFALITFQQVWCVTPSLRIFGICMGCMQKFFGTFMSCCLAPICETVGLCFSNITVKNA